jgi:hypothetical protein
VLVPGAGWLAPHDERGNDYRADQRS